MEDNQQQEQSKQDALKRGVAFQGLIRSEGWKFVKLYYEAKVKALATSLLEDKPIAEYEFQRQELIGIRKLLAYIDNDIRVLEDEHEKNTGTA